LSSEPTLFRTLVAQRHWQKYDTFATQFTRAADELAATDHDPRLAGLTIARRQLARWLAGAVKTKPYPDHCRVLEHLFGYPVEALFSPAYQASSEAAWDGEQTLVPSAGLDGFPGPTRSDENHTANPSAPDDGRNVDRRSMMSTIAVALGATLLEFTGSLAHSNVGERMLTYIEADAVRFAADYPEVAPSQLLPPVRETFEVVRTYLKGTQPIKHRRRLSRAAAQLATVAGMTLFNLGNQQQARWAFRAAAEAADEAEDDLLGAWALASECIIPTYNGDPWGVLDLAHRGQRLAAAHQCVVIAKLAALEAKAHASLGNHPATQGALAQARRAMTSATSDEYRAGPFGFTPAKHAFYEGTCYVRLGRPDAALAASQRALTLYQSTGAFMEPTIARIDMAMAHQQKGDLDGVCHMSEQVAAIPRQFRTGPITARISEFLAGLHPRDRALPAVRALRDRLALAPPTASSRSGMP
jgi:hypothetical protein